MVPLSYSQGYIYIIFTRTATHFHYHASAFTLEHVSKSSCGYSLKGAYMVLQRSLGIQKLGFLLMYSTPRKEKRSLLLVNYSPWLQYTYGAKIMDVLANPPQSLSPTIMCHTFPVTITTHADVRHMRVTYLSGRGLGKK